MAVPSAPIGFEITPTPVRFRLTASVTEEAGSRSLVVFWQYRTATTNLGLNSASWVTIDDSASTDLDFLTPVVGRDQTRWFAVRAASLDGFGAEAIGFGTTPSTDGLPQEIELTGSGSSSPVSGFGDFGSGDWRGGIDGTQSKNKLAATIVFSLTGFRGPRFPRPAVSSVTIGGTDFNETLKTARMILSSASGGGGTVYFKGVPNDLTTSGNTVYALGISDADVTDILVSGVTTVYLRFEKANDPVDADIGSKSTGGPTSGKFEPDVHWFPVDTGITVQRNPVPTVALDAEPHWFPVDHGIDVQTGNPSIDVEAEGFSGSFRDAEPGTVSSGNPTASVGQEKGRATARNARIGPVTTAAPSFDIDAILGFDPVDVRIVGVETAAAAHVFQTGPDDDPVEAELGTVALSGPTVRLPNVVIGDLYAEVEIGTVRVGTPRYALRPDVRDLSPLTDAEALAAAHAQRRNLSRASDLFALTITHPDIADDIHLVADNMNMTIDGVEFQALAFRAVPPSFQEGEVPRAVLEIDNVGRELTEWVEKTGGGRGAMMTVMQVMRDPQVTAEGHVIWSLPALPVGVAELTNETVQVALAYRTGRSRPGVKWRHDHNASPGLFG